MASIIRGCSRQLLAKPKNEGFGMVKQRGISATNANHAKVTVLGAAGGIGQSLAMMLKMNPLVTNLALYDVKNVDGIGRELSHIDTSTHVSSFTGVDKLEKALDGCGIAVIAAGIPRKPGMTRDDLFEVNAGIVSGLMEKITKLVATPTVFVITNPVNSLVPLCHYMMSAKLIRLTSCYLLGVTTLDCVRASHFYAEHLGKDPRDVIVPVIGGHSEKTIVPLFSQSNFPLDERNVALKLTELVRNAGSDVIKAKGGEGSATLSMAYSAHRVINSFLESTYGKTTYECAYACSNVAEGVDFFGSYCKFNPRGIIECVPLWKVAEWEKELLAEMLPELKKDIEKGMNYAVNKSGHRGMASAKISEMEF